MATPAQVEQIYQYLIENEQVDPRSLISHKLSDVIWKSDYLESQSLLAVMVSFRFTSIRKRAASSEISTLPIKRSKERNSPKNSIPGPSGLPKESKKSSSKPASSSKTSKTTPPPRQHVGRRSTESQDTFTRERGNEVQAMLAIEAESAADEKAIFEAKHAEDIEAEEIQASAEAHERHRERMATRAGVEIPNIIGNIFLIVQQPHWVFRFTFHGSGKKLSERVRRRPR